MKYIGIIGSRRRNGPEDFLVVQEAFCQIYEEGDVIVSGGCPKGGDSFAITLADIWDAPMEIYWPDWKRHGRFAGFVRNKDIAFRSKDYLIACVAENRKGGTEDTIKKWDKYHGFLGKLILV